MTKLNFREIIVDPDRFRGAEKVEELMESLKRFGLLQPILVDRTERGYVLVAGFRRFTAASRLGWDSIECTFRDSLDPIVAKEIELEENIQREQMTWQERVSAIAQIDSMRRAKNPNWTQQQTAAVAGVDRQATVSDAITLTKMMEVFPEIKKAKNANQAMQWAKSMATKVQNTLEVRESAPQSSPVASRIILGDSVDLIRAVPAESVHAIITDPPFGIDYDQQKEGTESSLTSYKDDEENYVRLLSMAGDLYRVLKPNGWLIWFLGISWYERVKNHFRATGFTVDEIPIIWNRSGGRTFTSRPDRYFARGYDIALHCFKGSPELVIKGKPNVITVDPVPTEERDLTVERPVELYAELIRRTTIPGQRVLDCFTGSGSCLAAAAQLKRDFLGFELSELRRAYAIRKVSAHYAE